MYETADHCQGFRRPQVLDQAMVLIHINYCVSDKLYTEYQQKYTANTEHRLLKLHTEQIAAFVRNCR